LQSGFKQKKSTRKLTFLGAISWWARVDSTNSFTPAAIAADQYLEQRKKSVH